jgi:hypothetical protein
MTVRSFAAFILLLYMQFTLSAAAVPDAEKTNQQEIKVEKNEHLEIRDKLIIEKNYSASTSVSIDENKVEGLNLKVGSSVKATEVKIILHNIFGQVYFKGNLEPLLEIIKNRKKSVKQ